jgi:integrase
MLRASDRTFKVLLFSLWETGCRPKEARTLAWDNVREDRWILPQHKTAHATGKPRVIYLSRPMRRLMAVLCRENAGECVFVNEDGRPWTADALRNRVQQLKAKLGPEKDVCAYLIRHAFGTRSILKGNDVLTTAVLMGHASTNLVTSVYAHLANEQKYLFSAVERIRSAASTPSPASPRSTA